MATEALNPQSNNPQHDKGDTALARGARTTLQAILGTFAAFVVGVFMTVWNVPGVPEALINYVAAHLPEVLLTVGIPTGVTSFVWNVLRPNVRNW